MNRAKVKLNIRPEISEAIAWSLFKNSQEELESLIEGHHSMTTPLSLEEREAVCHAWKVLEGTEDFT